MRSATRVANTRLELWRASKHPVVNPDLHARCMKAYHLAPREAEAFLAEHYIWLVATAQSEEENAVRPLVSKLTVARATELLADEVTVPPDDCGPRSFWPKVRRTRRAGREAWQDSLAVLAMAIASARVSVSACVTVQALLEDRSGRQRMSQSQVVWAAAATIARACRSERFMRRCRIRLYTLIAQKHSSRRSEMLERI